MLYIGKPYQFPAELLRAFELGIPVQTGVYLSKSDESRRWMSAVAPFREADSDSYAILEVDISVEELFARLEKRNREILWLELFRAFLLALFFALLWLGISRTLRHQVHLHIKTPLSRFMDFIGHLNQDDLSQRLHLQTGDEIESLADSFNHLVDRLQIAEELSSLLMGEDVLSAHYRRVHTLKGLVGALEMQEFQDALHQYEEKLQSLREGNPADEDELGAVFTEAEETGRETIRKLKEQLGDLLDWDEDILKIRRSQYLNWLNHEALPKTLKAEMAEVLKIPLQNLFENLGQMASELAERQEKMLHSIQMEGGETRVAPQILGELPQVLVHVVRNMVDHGIEGPEERENQGKDPFGQLRFASRIEEKELILEFQDDGKGMEPAHLRRVSVKKGLMTQEEAEKATDQEALEFIFLPGFSSAEAVSEISGRGVGMDALRQTSMDLGGAVRVQSIPGIGTALTITLPLQESA